MPNDDDLAVELLGRTDHGQVAASLRAMPFLALARHVVVDGRVLLRLHRGCGYHPACLGSVVAYGTDNLDSAGPGESVWSVQIVGRCEAVEPTAAHRGSSGPRRGSWTANPTTRSIWASSPSSPPSTPWTMPWNASSGAPCDCPLIEDDCL